MHKSFPNHTRPSGFRRTDPDAGSVIGLIFAHQMSENIRRLNQVTDKYRTEFVNMLNISLRPAYPANGVVVMDLVSDTILVSTSRKGRNSLAEPADDNRNSSCSRPNRTCM